MEPQRLHDARQVYATAIPKLLQLRNVVACGLGYKIVHGRRTDKLSFIVSVTRKVPPDQLPSQELVPQTIAGFVTDVVETGPIRAFTPTDPKARHRPAVPGVSIGHRDITAGTFGLLVERGSETFILSNNHVLANINAGEVGDPIYQPGPSDGGTSDDAIATLAEFEPIDFGESSPECRYAELAAKALNLLAQITGSQHRIQAVRQTAGVNRMDAALAKPDRPDLVEAAILEVGLPTGVTEPELGQSVQKMGRTTGLTQGTVTQIDVTVNVDYAGRKARFEDQVFTSPMSNPGDSGSTILDMDRKIVGQLFAGSSQVTILTPIQRILGRFNVIPVLT
jgi:hypothetical protein